MMRMQIRTTASLAGMVLALGGCVIDVADVCVDGDWCTGDAEVSATFSRSVPAQGRGTLQVVGANGEIRIRGEEGLQEVVILAERRVRADTRAEAEAYLLRVRVVVSEHADEVVVKTEQPSEGSGRSYQVDYDIAVPSWMAIRIANGNGLVEVRDARRSVEVESGNGDVVLRGHQGSSWIALGNGEIRGDVVLPPGGRLIHAAGNGGIHLTVQRGVSADFHAQVGVGVIDVSGLDFTSWVSGTGFAEGMLGAGDGLISLSVGNGWIQIQGVSGT